MSRAHIVTEDRVDRALAVAALARLDLEPHNRALAELWLSLWSGDGLPPRSAISPSRLKPYLSGLILFDVVPDTSVTIRLAGTRYRHVLGAELTGKDWLALSPPDYRPKRLAIFSAVARGTMVVAHRRVQMTMGEDYISQEILLPFAAVPGATPAVLAHVNFQPMQFLEIKSLAQVTADPMDFEMIALRAARQAPGA